MVKAYIVARAVEVTFTWFAKIGGEIKKGTYWTAPVMDKDARIFANKNSAVAYRAAVAYRDRMNKELHNPKRNADGSFTLNVAPYGDFYIFSLERGQ